MSNPTPTAARSTSTKGRKLAKLAVAAGMAAGALAVVPGSASARIPAQDFISNCEFINGVAIDIGPMQFCFVDDIVVVND